MHSGQEERDVRTVVVLNGTEMGRGDRGLGQKILAIFLRKAMSLRGLTAVVLYNEAVKLLLKDSPVLAELTLLEERGVDLMPCVTCIDYLGLDLGERKVSGMDQILQELDRADKVITL